MSPGLLQLTFQCISDGLMSRLQSVQNAAAGVHVSCQAFDGMTTLRRCYTPVPRVPFRKWVDFKIAILVHRSLSGTAAAYLTADCQLSYDEGRRQLRSLEDLSSASLGNDVSQLPVSTPAQDCGTAFQLVSGKRTSA